MYLHPPSKLKIYNMTETQIQVIYSLDTYCLSFETIKQMSLKILNICRPLGGWVVLQDPLIFESFIKDLTHIVLRVASRRVTMFGNLF